MCRTDLVGYLVSFLVFAVFSYRTQRKVHFLTNYFKKQLGNLLLSSIFYFKQEHCKQQFVSSINLSTHPYAKYHVHYAAENCNGLVNHLVWYFFCMSVIICIWHWYTCRRVWCEEIDSYWHAIHLENWINKMNRR